MSIQERAERRTGLLGCLTGRRRAHREEREWAATAEGLLERLGIAHHAREQARALSYGAQRRVEIARALALRPRVLLLDEPVAGMTDTEAGELGNVFGELCDDGMAVLLIEHNVPFVTSVCDEVHVLSHGQLIASGAAEHVVRDRAVVEAYLGS